MTDPTPFTGYVPRFEFPVVAPPPPSFSGSPEDYYQQLPFALSTEVSGPNGEFVDITLARTGNTGPVEATLYAMTGGFVRYYPEGMTVPSPDGFAAPAGGVLVLTTWAGDVEAQQRVFPPGTPSIGRIYYVGVDATQTALVLRTETARMSEAVLRVSWRAQQSTAPPPNTTLDALIDAHNERVMTGAGSVFVDGGSSIGKAAQDTSAAIDTFRFTLRMAASGPPPAYISPTPVILGAPFYDF